MPPALAHDGNQVSDATNRLVLISNLLNGGVFNKVTFISDGSNAFEFDNVSANAVPIPAALPLFGTGLGLLGLLARRRRARFVA